MSTYLEQFRTAALGGHVDACPECGYVHVSYNSCRDRHCPKCQGLERELWIQDRKEDLMPVKYFHLVFTLPQALHPLLLYHRKKVLEYIGRYSHRVAISNSRIKAVDEKCVTFDYKDYKQGGKHQFMTLTTVEFLRRFSLHVLPKGFVRIRHFGFLAGCNREKWRKVQGKLGQPLTQKKKMGGGMREEL